MMTTTTTGVVTIDDSDLAECEMLEAEPDEGNMEYKLKLVGLTADRIDHLTTQMNFRLREGQGEAIYRVGVDDDGTPIGIPDVQLKETLRVIHQMAERLDCSVAFIRVALGRSGGRLAELFVQKSLADFLDIKMCIVGNVDSGKSTLVGVLTQGKLDDGRGRARMSVFQHRHEIETGRTSSISRQILGFDSNGEVTNYDDFRNPTWEDIVEDSSKILTLIDLAGHERYLKTTLFGMTAHAPDYALLAIAANNGVLRMTKQHLGVCLALNIPFFVVFTKVDICPEHVLKNNMKELTSILKSEKVQRLPVLVKDETNIEECANNLSDRLITPVFQLSCVTGDGIPLLKSFLNRLPIHKNWSRHNEKPTTFSMDEAFSVPGVGTVVSGVVLRGCVSSGDVLQFGPDSTGSYRNVSIKSIHVQRNPSNQAQAGQHATLALKRVKRSECRSGMVLLSPSLFPSAVRRFDATILILNHRSEIKTGYQPVVHVGTVVQSAKIVSLSAAPVSVTDVGQESKANPEASSGQVGANGEAASTSDVSSSNESNDDELAAVRTGDRALVTFEFAHYPEYLIVGSKLIFREGSTKGIGRVVKLHT